MSSSLTSGALYASRLARVRQEMQRRSIDAALLSVGHDLPYLTGYYAMPLERLTMLVVTQDSVATLIVPRLEAPRVTPFDDVFRVVPWGETKTRWKSWRKISAAQSASQSVIKCGPGSSSN